MTRAPRHTGWAAVGCSLPVAAFALVPFVAGDHPLVRSFALVYISIILEALPFLLLGALVGGGVEVLVSRERLTALLPRRQGAVPFVAAALGLLFPVCECAVVPAVRRLVGKGFPLSAAVAYLLGGPIVNPLVAASTAMAYASDARMVTARLAAGYGIAVAVALLMGRWFAARPAVLARLAQAEPAAPGHGLSGPAPAGRGVRVLRHAAEDFLVTAPYVVVGAALAALAQTVVDRRVVLALAGWPLLPEAAMMLLAVLLNLCSEADAFIAASFRGLVPGTAQLAFLLLGPMLDLKLLLLYRTLFTRRALLILALLIPSAVAVVVAALGLSGWGGP